MLFRCWSETRLLRKAPALSETLGQQQLWLIAEPLVPVAQVRALVREYE